MAEEADNEQESRIFHSRSRCLHLAGKPMGVPADLWRNGQTAVYHLL